MDSVINPAIVRSPKLAGAVIRTSRARLQRCRRPIHCGASADHVDTIHHSHIEGELSGPTHPETSEIY